MSLKGQAMGGARWAAAGQVAVSAIGLLQVALLGRLLSHGDFGLMAISMAVVGFAQLLSDLGLPSSLIFHQQTSRRQRATLYWMNLLLGLALTFGLAGAAARFADLSGVPAAAPVLRGLAPLFLITAIGAQFRALHQRDLRFDLLAKIDILSAFTGLAVGLLAALGGWGALALVGATLSSALVTSGGHLLCGWRRYWPGWALCREGVGDHLSFGAFRMGENLVNYVNSQMDVILIGRLLGAEALGLYVMARNLCMRPLTLLNPVFGEVAFPLMARVQGDADLLRRAYLKGLRLLTLLNAPAHLLILLGAEPLVLLLLGPTWIAAVPVIRVLALAWLIRSMGNPVGVLLLATGNVSRGFYWNCAQLLLVPPLILGGIRLLGLEGAAAAILLSQILLLVPLWYFLIRPVCSARLSEFGGALLAPFLFAVTATVPAAVLASMIPSPLAATLALGVLSLVAGVGLLRRFDPEAWLAFKGVLRG